MESPAPIGHDLVHLDLKSDTSTSSVIVKPIASAPCHENCTHPHSLEEYTSGNRGVWVDKNVYQGLKPLSSGPRYSVGERVMCGAHVRVIEGEGILDTLWDHTGSPIIDPVTGLITRQYRYTLADQGFDTDDFELDLGRTSAWEDELQPKPVRMCFEGDRVLLSKSRHGWYVEQVLLQRKENGQWSYACHLIRVEKWTSRPVSKPREGDRLVIWQESIQYQ